MEFDQEIIKKSFKYLGAITYKFPKACDLAVRCLLEIFQHGENFIVNQAIIICRDILRKYHDKSSFEILKLINLDFAKKINIPESKCALLYIIGEYANKLDCSVDILSWYSGNFHNENEKVKLQILNASLKNFVIEPNASEEITKYVLEKAGEECENADIRDRAYIYWRLLESDPDAAKEILIGEKPDFEYRDEKLFEEDLLNDLVENLTNISCLYQKKSVDMIIPEDLVIEASIASNEEELEKEDANENNSNDVSNKEKEKQPKHNKAKLKKNQIIESKINTNDCDLLGLGDSGNSSVNTLNYNLNAMGVNMDIMDIFGRGNKIPVGSESGNQYGSQSNIDNSNNFITGNENSNINVACSQIQSINNNQDIFSDIQFIDDENTECNIFPKTSGVSQPRPVKVLDKNIRGKNGVDGLTVYSLFHRDNKKLFLGLNLKNDFHLAMTNFSFLISKNILGINLDYENNKKIIQEFYLNSETKKNLILNLKTDMNNSSLSNINDLNQMNLQTPLSIEIIIKNNVDDYYVNIPIYFNCLNLETGKMSNQSFMEYFKKFSNIKTNNNLTNIKSEIINEESLSKILEKNNIFMIAKNNKLDPPVYFYSGLIELNIPYVLEIAFLKGKNIFKSNILIFRIAEGIISKNYQ